MDSGEESEFGSFWPKGSDTGTSITTAIQGDDEMSLWDSLDVASSGRKMSGVEYAEGPESQPPAAENRDPQSKRMTRRRCSSVSRMSIGDTSSRELCGMLLLEQPRPADVLSCTRYLLTITHAHS
jgi:hypothetical protein